MQLIDIAHNLIDERERLGYSRKNFAAQVNKTDESLRLYETGKANMSAEFLAAAAQLGVDVQFVLTGVKSENLHMVAQKFENELNQVLNENHGGVQFNAEVSGSPIVGNHNTVNQVTGTQNNITTQKHITKTVVEISPDDNRIDEEEKAILLDLVNKIVAKEQEVKRKPKTHRAVWSSLNAHCQVSTYKLIAKDDFEKAKMFLRKWLGNLNNTATSKRNNPTAYRNNQYSTIHVKIKELGLEEWYRDTLKSKFGVDSSTELDEVEMKKLVTMVNGKYSREKKKLSE
ncbi:transcriptional regulator [Alysiella crassa]|uniref:ORF6C domain n=1 Tax=Alysiella crassa TaxID=153491 RepID=A0A376BV28_9NEIS|nr:transcriptional regulator [Alysiella crassa]UOP06199.1 ORF6C domain-containing protein [Alysiella crassa]SSY80673.1 ORF6C domain [Alysiella crassa]